MSQSLGDIASSLGNTAISLIKRYATKKTLRNWTVDWLAVEQREPYTYVEVLLRHVGRGSESRGVGFSKQRPTDQWNKEIGAHVALSRAIKDALGIKEKR